MGCRSSSTSKSPTIPPNDDDIIAPSPPNELAPESKLFAVVSDAPKCDTSKEPFAVADVSSHIPANQFNMISYESAGSCHGGSFLPNIMDLFCLSPSQKILERTELKDLDLFVLDNSLRESTVGQIRGHTLADKLNIFQEVKRCGFNHMIVASFSHLPRVEDAFMEELVRRGENMKGMFAFTDAAENFENGVPDLHTIPVGLEKMKKYGIPNIIIEIDLADKTVDWDRKCKLGSFCDLLRMRIEWAHTNLQKVEGEQTKAFVNLRDFPFAMGQVPDRVFKVISYLSSLPKNIRPIGILFEEPTGDFLPSEVADWTRKTRTTMNEVGWTDAHLLVHVHEKWGFANHVQLECLANGANGIWCSICEEGAGLGHACSAVTIMNLIRLGNKKVLQRYNCTALRQAAINVTTAVTGDKPHPMHIIYGERALDLAFNFGGIEGGVLGPDEFDMAAFFGVKPPLRISTLTAPSMVVDRLRELFGEDGQFTVDIATKMLAVMIDDLDSNRKEEYMSEVGMAVLFNRAGGKLTSKMEMAINRVASDSAIELILLTEVRQKWDDSFIGVVDGSKDKLRYDAFYHNFMAPYTGCATCDDTKRALQTIDFHTDGFVDWQEFEVYLKWAIHENPKLKNGHEVIDKAFRDAIIPAMRHGK